MSTLATTDAGEQLAKGDIRSLLQSERVREQVALALPKHLSPDRMLRVALTAVNKNPKLLECTPQSVMLSMMTCSQYGVEPDGRHAHLIPYNVKGANGQWHMECQFQWDYKGLVAQIRKSPRVHDIYAEVICENDEYEVTAGLHRDLKHKYDIAKDRGPVIAVYSVCIYKDGGAPSFEIMTMDEVENIRMRSKSTNKETGKSSGPWLTDYKEMAKKTVVKRHSKWLPLPIEILESITADNDFDELPQAQATEITKAQVPTSKATTAALPERTVESAKHIQQTEKVEVVKDQKTEKVAPASVAGQSFQVEAEATKPAGNKSKLTTKKNTPIEATVVNTPPADDPKSKLVARTRSGLESAGFSEAQLVQVMINNEWDAFRTFDPATTKIEEFAIETLETFFEEDSWETILGELSSL